MSKLLLEELKRDKYYRCKNKRYRDVFYFRFEKILGNDIYSYGYEFRENNNVFVYDELISDSFCSLDWFNDCIIIEEVDGSFLSKYYPKNHKHLIDFRKQKINSLLTL